MEKIRKIDVLAFGGDVPGDKCYIRAGIYDGCQEFGIAKNILLYIYTLHL
ncbi:MAG: hypothetical protein HP000_03885 [Odoribacter sp.]|nr:hypothetical protein [Odoribacter sp.]